MSASTAFPPDRATLIAAAGAIAVLNLYATHIIEIWRTGGLAGAAFSLFGINAIVWFALFAMTNIAREQREHTLADRRDWLVVSGALLLCLLPWHALALPAAMLLASWSIFSGPAGSRTRRVGIILGSIAFTNLIGRCLLVAFGAPIVELDAQFVALLAGVDARANVVDFANGGRSFIVGLGCSSVHNMSLGFVLWAALTQLFDLRIDRRLVGWCVATVFALFLVNALRLTAIAKYPAHFDTLHDGVLAELFGWASLLVAAGVAAAGTIEGRRRAV